MSDPNDKLLDDYLRRDSIVSKHYRELGTDEVPSSLDDAVLAQARGSVARHSNARPRWMKWGASLALAASAVIAVAIVLEVGVNEEVRMPAPQVEQARTPQPTAEERVVQEVMQEAPAVTAPAPPNMEMPRSAPEGRALLAREESRFRDYSASSERAAIESVTGEAAGRRETLADTPIAVTTMAASDDDRSSESSAAKATNAPAEAFANPPQDARDIQESEAVVIAGSQASGTRAGRTDTATPSAPVRPSAVAPAQAIAQQAPRLAPDVWLEQIRSLRREGKLLEADEQWKQFSEAYPQFEVAQTDSARPAR